MPSRYAIYFAPAAAGPLATRAAAWLGRNAAGGAVPQPVLPGVAPDLLLEATGSARRYGFHATIKAPMRLATEVVRADLEAALAEFALAQERLAIGPLVIRPIDGFLAIVPRQQSQALTDFAARCVIRFEPFRAPPDAAERQKRQSASLTPRQADLLERYGYPYVMEEFRFHMTLTDRLPEAERRLLLEAAEAWFAADLGQELWLDRLVLFEEAEPGAPFRRCADYPLSAEVTA